jgi:hypothetical protein
MKALLLIPLSLLLEANGCNSSVSTQTPARPPVTAEKSKTCIDSSRIRRDAVCPMNWAPVCGCDSVTYGNACAAEAAGVTWYREGECLQK